MKNCSTNKKKHVVPDPWMKNTALYKQCQKRNEEINRHKWYESEKAGYDIGWERAATDWLVRHGSPKK